MPEFSLPTGSGPDTAYLTSAIGTSGEAAWGDTTLIDEDFSTNDTTLWAYTHSAGYDSAGQRAMVCGGADNSEGQLEYLPGIGRSFEATWDFTCPNAGSGYHQHVFFADHVDRNAEADPLVMENGYLVDIHLDQNWLRLNRIEAGSGSVLQQWDGSVGGSQSYRVRVDVGAGRVTVEQDGVVRIDWSGAIDTTYDTYGWNGAHGIDNGAKYVDNIVAKAI